MKNMTSKQQGLSPCAVGCVSFWSFLPLISELRRMSGSMDLRVENSNQLGSLLEEQGLDLGFCPVTSLVTRSDLELAMPLGEAIYGSYGPAYFNFCEQGSDLLPEIRRRLVQINQVFDEIDIPHTSDWTQASSRFWDSLRALEKTWPRIAPRLKLCSSNSAYIGLAKLLYRMIFGEAASESLELQASSNVDASSGPVMEFRCGNEAMSRRCCHSCTLDLSDTWYQLTGLPFVPHVLLKNQRCQVSQFARQQLVKASELAQAKMHVDPVSYLPDLLPLNHHGQAIDLALVWKHVSYRLNQDALKSIRLFLQLLRPLARKKETDESFRLKMIRWQQREAESALQQRL